MSGYPDPPVQHLAPGLVPGHTGDVYSFDAAADGADLRTTGPEGIRVNPEAMPGWDNTARSSDTAYVFHSGNPVTFRRWLSEAVEAAQQAGPDTMVFVNS